jgi:16S rRNA (guanine527-N7)-methyltransferase
LRAAAEEIFGPALGAATRYAELLVTDGVVRGLLGPREGARIWDRHLLNSAVVASLLPAGARVVDVGSGAGLPGIPIALASPTSQVLLVEPLERRCVFLAEVVADLELGDRVTVVRGRAPEIAAQLPFFGDYVVARAVAPLERLVSWTMPMVRPSGELLALRGERAKQELQEAGPGLAKYGAGVPEVVEVGAQLLETPVRVVRVPRLAVQRKGDVRVRGRRGS